MAEGLPRINIAEPLIGEEEKEAVLEVLDSGMLAQGKNVNVFEEQFAEYCNSEYAVMLNSGTAAIHTALHSLGIGPNDEVITTPFTFIGTVNPIVMCGAEPRFVDIAPDNFNIDVSKIENAITSNTKAIVAVDLFGQPFDYTELRDIADRHKIHLVEDACQSVGAEYKQLKSGILGKIGAFSLYATKNIVSGEGGVLTTNDASIADDARSFRQHGMTGPYEYEGLGYNYRATDLVAALARVQLDRVDTFNSRRRQNAEIYDRELQGLKGLITPKVSPDRTHVYHQYTIRVTQESSVSRDILKRKLDEIGIGTGIYYPQPLHFYKHVNYVGYTRGSFPEAERAATEVLSLPVHPKVTEKQVSFIATSIREIINE